jgi:ribosomal protein S18 acetylase RimI-like enzyme
VRADPRSGPAVTLREPIQSEADAVQAVWEASLAYDDPASWPRGGWSAAGWATATRVLVVDNRIVGVAGIRAQDADDDHASIRVALDLDARQPAFAALLVDSALDLAREADATRVRLWVPARAGWLQAAARDAGFTAVRGVAHMLLPAESPTPDAAPPKGYAIRPMRDDEDQTVLDALNRAWASTWAFVPIPLEMLQRDLEGQREGMLLAIDASSERIIGTCHAVWEPREQNPDGSPRAWISNLTVDPEFRQRGIARTMLRAGIARLRTLGASSITLGVDSGDPAPMRLYTSAGFVVVSGVEAWDRDFELSGASVA